MYKIHIPPVPKHLFIGELKNILHAGVLNHPDTKLETNEIAADLILVDFRHLEHRLYTIKHPQKTIIIDYRDQAQLVFSEPALLYFKRSIIVPEHRALVPLPRLYTPIAYCARQEYLNLTQGNHIKRDIDIAVFFDPQHGEQLPNNVFRASVARFVQRHYAHLNIFVGHAGEVGEAGRSEFQPAYAEKLRRAKIIVTCNPDRWEGDNRLFESLASGAAVLVDRMLTPMKNPFLEGTHLLYYDRQNLDSLANALNSLLNNDEKRLSIAAAGHRHLLQHHKPADRIQEILDEVEMLI